MPGDHQWLLSLHSAVHALLVTTAKRCAHHHADLHHARLHLCSHRVKDWVRTASNLDAPEEDDLSHDEPPMSKRKGAQSRFGPGADAVVAVHLKPFSNKQHLPRKSKYFDASDDDDYEQDEEAPLTPGLQHVQSDRLTDGGGSEAASSFAGSMADGMSESGASGIDACGSAAGGHEDDLAVDTR